MGESKGAIKHTRDRGLCFLIPCSLLSAWLFCIFLNLPIFNPKSVYIETLQQRHDANGVCGRVRCLLSVSQVTVFKQPEAMGLDSFIVVFPKEGRGSSLSQLGRLAAVAQVSGFSTL